MWNRTHPFQCSVAGVVERLGAGFIRKPFFCILLLRSTEDNSSKSQFSDNFNKFEWENISFGFLVKWVFFVSFYMKRYCCKWEADSLLWGSPPLLYPALAHVQGKTSYTSSQILWHKHERLIIPLSALRLLIVSAMMALSCDRYRYVENWPVSRRTRHWSTRCSQ